MVHFLALALVLFATFSLLNGDREASPREIRIDEATLLNYVQYRSRAFNEDQARQRLGAMPAAEKKRIVNNLIREEVLYREALAMGMDKEDYVIKQRLIQKMEYLARGFGLENTELENAEVEAYFRNHAATYVEAPGATFTHVFIKAEDNGDVALAKAGELLAELNNRQVAFSRATTFGDRFIYHSNYVERDKGLIASHFGDEFAEALFALPADENHWQGPLRSRYGAHLVLLTNKTPGGLPPLESIYSRVAEDAKQWVLSQQADKAIAEMIDQYRVEITVPGYEAAAIRPGSPAATRAAAPQE